MELEIVPGCKIAITFSVYMVADKKLECNLTGEAGVSLNFLFMHKHLLH